MGGRRNLAVVLVGLGLRAGSRARASGLRFAATVLATAAVCTATASVVAAHAVYDSMHTRSVARAPVLHDGEGDPRLWWGAGFDVVDGRQLTLVLISPVAEDAPLPPGLDRWPEPGEAVLSPALLRAGADEGIADRYGYTVSTIGLDGLSGPDEMFAYLRPTADLLDTTHLLAVDGFGSLTTSTFGDLLFARPEWTLQLLLGLFVVLPALVLLFVAARTGSQARDRRVALAVTLGARRRHRVLIALGEAGPAVLTGAIPALALTLAATRVEIRLPVTEYLLPTADLREHLPWLVAAWLLGLLTTLAALAALDGVAAPRARRPRPLGSRRAPVRTAALFPLMLLVAARGPLLFEPGTPLFLLANYVGIIGTLLTVPAVVGLLVAGLGRGVARLAGRGSLAGSLLAGRWLAANAGSVARIATGMVAAIGLLIQTQVWLGFLGAPVQQAQAIQERAGDSVQVVSLGGGASPHHLGAFFERLSGEAEPVWLFRDPLVVFPEEVRIVAGCPALSELGLPCPDTDAGTALSASEAKSDPRLAELLDLYAPRVSTVLVRTGDPAGTAYVPDGSSILALVAPGGASLRFSEIERAAYHTVPGTNTAGPIASGWLIGAALNSYHGRWVLLLGVVGVALLTVAFGLVGLGEFIRWSRRIAPVTVLAGNRRVAVASAAWTVLLPIAAAGGLGLALACWLATPVIATGYSQLSAPLIWSCAVAVTVLGLLLWGTAIRSAVRQFDRWTPGTE